MCDTATLLPADLISAEGGGGTGLNEHFSKGLKSVIARENTHFYRFFIYSIFSCYAIKTSESQCCFFTHISNYITTMLFFFLAYVVSTWGGLVIILLGLSAERVSFRRVSQNALYQKEDMQRCIQPTTKATTLNVHKVKMIYAFIQHMHTATHFFFFPSVALHFFAYFNEMNSLVCVFLKGLHSLLFMEYCCMFMIKTSAE